MLTLKVINKATGKIQESDFMTIEECNAWIKECESKGAWGELGSYDIKIIPKVQVIADISPRQIRLGLLAIGTTEKIVDAAILKLSSSTRDQVMIAWKYSMSFVRNSSVAESIGKLIGLDSSKLDQLWIEAGKL